jgi:hypothetical protein
MYIFTKLLLNNIFIRLYSRSSINLMDSPRNPMQQKQLERSTTFFILHFLFIDCNDIIDMQW